MAKKSFFKYVINQQPVIFRLFVLFVCILIVVAVLPKEKRFKYEYEKGTIWQHADLYATENIAILKSVDQLQKDKENALNAILPIYELDARIEQTQLNNYRKEFDLQWKVKYTDNKNRSNIFTIGLQLLEEFYNKGIINLNKKYQKSGLDYTITLSDNNVATVVSTASLLTVERAIQITKSRLNRYSVEEKEFILSLVETHLVPNIVYNEQLTKRLEDELLSQVSTTRGMIQVGELIIGKGDVIDEELFYKLESLRNKHQEQSVFSGKREVVAIGQFILVALSISLILVFLSIFRRDIFTDYRKLTLIFIIVTFMLVALSWAISINLPSIYYIPYCIVPIIIRLLFDSRLALNIHLLVVIIAGFFVPNGFEFVFLQITAGMAAIYSIRNLLRRSQFLYSAALILLTYTIGFVGISIIHEGTFTGIDWLTIGAFFVSVVLSLLAYPLIYLFEKLFGITSEVTLMELTNTNSTLLRELSFKAPGTFQHSLQVANLAEAAIFEIGGNALLTRAGALYHDIGKIHNPVIFIENQKVDNNPHDTIKFEESAQLIIRHVTDGTKLAEKHGLPNIIIDFIRTHHGTTRVDFFYQSFLKNYPDTIPDEKVFRYPGPIPFTKETAVLMLADSVEAASRSLKNPTPEAISELVERIINYKLNQNQLIESPITLKDIVVIKQIFKQMLQNIYHVRVDYEI